MNNVMESLVPYISYFYASRTYKSLLSKKEVVIQLGEKGGEGKGGKVSDYSNSRLEKEFFKPRLPGAGIAVWCCGHVCIVFPLGSCPGPSLGSIKAWLHIFQVGCPSGS